MKLTLESLLASILMAHSSSTFIHQYVSLFYTMVYLKLYINSLDLKLAKLMIAGAGHMAGFDGAFEFTNIGR